MNSERQHEQFPLSHLWNLRSVRTAWPIKAALYRSSSAVLQFCTSALTLRPYDESNRHRTMKLIIYTLMVLTAVAASGSAHILDIINGGPFMRTSEKRHASRCTTEDFRETVGTSCWLSYGGEITDFEEFCASSCSETIIKTYRICEMRMGDYLAEQCAQNAVGDTCASISATISQRAAAITTNCLTGSGYNRRPTLPYIIDCNSNQLVGCAAALRRSNQEIGCCINTMNFTSITGDLPVASNRLWVECGVTPPGFCSSAAVVQFSLLLAALMVLVAAVLA